MRELGWGKIGMLLDKQMTSQALHKAGCCFCQLPAFFISCRSPYLLANPAPHPTPRQPSPPCLPAATLPGTFLRCWSIELLLMRRGTQTSLVRCPRAGCALVLLQLGAAAAAP